MRAIDLVAVEWREFVAFLRTRALVLVSILLLTGLYGIGLAVPQRVRLAPSAYAAWRASRPRLVRALEAAGLTDVFRSPIVYFATGLFFASLLAVIWERIPRIVRRTRLEHGIPLEPAALARRKGTRRIPVAEEEEAVRRAAGLLEASGYRIYEPRPGALRAVRFRWAPLGFLAFHGAFGLLLAGAITIDLTRYSAWATIGEGEAFDAASGPFRNPPKPPKTGAAHPELAFQVLDVRPERESGMQKRLGADLLFAGEATPRHVEVNQPAVLGSTSVLITGAGPAPLFACGAPGGASSGVWVKMKLDRDGVTHFALPECGLRVAVRPAEQPQRLGKNGQGVMLQATGAALGPEALADGVEVLILRAGGVERRGVLVPGGEMATDDVGGRLAMPEVRLYATFEIVDERGGALLWVGFALGVLGLVFRLVLFRREVVAVASGGAVLLAFAAEGAGLAGESSLLARLELFVASPEEEG